MLARLSDKSAIVHKRQPVCKSSSTNSQQGRTGSSSKSDEAEKLACHTQQTNHTHLTQESDTVTRKCHTVIIDNCAQWHDAVQDMKSYVFPQRWHVYSASPCQGPQGITPEFFLYSATPSTCASSLLQNAGSSARVPCCRVRGGNPQE